MGVAADAAVGVAVDAAARVAVAAEVAAHCQRQEEQDVPFELRGLTVGHGVNRMLRVEERMCGMQGSWCAGTGLRSSRRLHPYQSPSHHLCRS